MIFFCVLLVFGLFVIKFRMEEKFLEEEFGEEYARYKREVKALIPYVLEEPGHTREGHRACNRYPIRSTGIRLTRSASWPGSDNYNSVHFFTIKKRPLLKS